MRRSFTPARTRATSAPSFRSSVVGPCACVNGAPSLRSRPMLWHHFLRARKASLWLLRRVVVTAAVLSIVLAGLTAGRSYFACEAMGTVSSSPSCSHSSRASHAEVDTARCACCARFTLHAVTARALSVEPNLSVPHIFLASGAPIFSARDAIIRRDSLAERRRRAGPRDRPVRSLLQAYLI